jgi:hypothetical protein
VRTTEGQLVREVIKTKVDNVNVSDDEIDKQYSVYEGLPEGKGYKEGPQWDMDRVVEDTGEDVVIIVWAEPASQPTRDTRATEGAFLMISIDGKDAVQMKVKKGQRLEEVDGLSQMKTTHEVKVGGKELPWNKKVDKMCGRQEIILNITKVRRITSMLTPPMATGRGATHSEKRAREDTEVRRREREEELTRKKAAICSAK